MSQSRLAKQSEFTVAEQKEKREKIQKDLAHKLAVHQKTLHQMAKDNPKKIEYTSLITSANDHTMSCLNHAARAVRSFESINVESTSLTKIWDFFKLKKDLVISIRDKIDDYPRMSPEEAASVNGQCRELFNDFRNVAFEDHNRGGVISESLEVDGDKVSRLNELMFTMKDLLSFEGTPPAADAEKQARLARLFEHCMVGFKESGYWDELSISTTKGKTPGRPAFIDHCLAYGKPDEVRQFFSNVPDACQGEQFHDIMKLLDSVDSIEANRSQLGNRLYGSQEANIDRVFHFLWCLFCSCDTEPTTFQWNQLKGYLGAIRKPLINQKGLSDDLRRSPCDHLKNITFDGKVAGSEFQRHQHQLMISEK